MSLEQITEDYLVSMDEVGTRLYQEMRDAEIDWISKTGFRWQSFDKRTFLLVATSQQLPDFSELERTRAEFNSWVKSEAERQGRPMTIGDRSTALPVWITEEKKIPIGQPLPDDVEPVIKVNFRTQTAWRAAVLNQEEVLILFGRWIAQLEMRIENCARYGKKADRLDAEARLNELLQKRQEAMSIYGAHPHVSARLYSGKGTRFYFKTPSFAWGETIANVGLVLGTASTIVAPATITRVKPTKQKHIATIGRIGFFETQPSI